MFIPQAHLTVIKFDTSNSAGLLTSALKIKDVLRGGILQQFIFARNCHLPV
jgi:hypothetical protein